MPPKFDPTEIKYGNVIKLLSKMIEKKSMRTKYANLQCNFQFF